MKRLVFGVVCLALIFSFQAFAKDAVKEFKLVAKTVGKSKYWLIDDGKEPKDPPPALELHVKKGDKVKIHAISKASKENNVHGLKIPDFSVEQVVTGDKETVFEFVADKTGTFPIQCHLHPPHVGGKIIVE